MTSCKHTYHPFCLGEILKLQNKCLIYDQLLHLDFYNNPSELVSFIGGQGHKTSLGSPTMLNNDEIDSPLKTSAKV